jgi:lysophospholipase L1-like esterase
MRALLGVAVLHIAAVAACTPSDGGFPIIFPDEGERAPDVPDADGTGAAEDVGTPEEGGGAEDAGPGEEAAEPDAGDVPIEPDVPPEEAGDDGEAPPPAPIGELDDLRLYVNIGDSLAAGYNASGRNGDGGHGYARLVLDNHPDYPEYEGHFLRALYADVRFVDVSESGATSSDALENVRSALRGSLPASVDGDVLVSLTCGGNDFNDDITTMMLRASTEAAAARLQGNYREIVRLLRERYEDPAAGHAVVFLVTNVHDPTGGTGAIPPGFDEGFCGTINDPRLIPFRAVAIGNLVFFNEQIAAVTTELGGWLVDNHGVFFDHGMNAPGAERWISDDCVHPTNEGHHQLRREEWFVLTGERL